MRISDWSSDVCSSDLPLVPDLRHDAFQRHHVGLQEGVETHDAEPDRTLAPRRIPGAPDFVRRAVDEILQHVVEKAHYVRDEGRMSFPFRVFLEIQRRQDGKSGGWGTSVTVRVDLGGSRDINNNTHNY